MKLYGVIMKAGERLGCHQRSDRSFHFKGYQFPVCARCTGVFIGYLSTPFIYIFCGLNVYVCLCLCLVMLLDWGIQFFEIKESTNIRRLVTGILGGIGVLGIEILVLNSVQYIL